jgi:hypothetical protein
MSTTTTQIKARLRKGDKFRLTADALDNYGPKYADRTFTVSHVSTAYMPAAEFYAKGRPDGFHPGFDESAGCALYDADELTFSVYEWEVRKS